MQIWTTLDRAYTPGYKIPDWHPENGQEGEEMSQSYEEINAILTRPGEMFEIEQINLDGQVIKSWKNTPPNMATILQRSLDYGDREFIIYRDERMTFAEHYAQAAALANRLVSQFDIGKGDRVAIAMRNYPEWSVAFWAAAAAGALAVPLNAWWTSDELRYGLADSGAKIVFVDQERLERVQAVRSQLPGLQQVVAARCAQLPQGVLDFNGMITDAVRDKPLPVVDIQPDDHATIFYTSGTTGFPKGTLGTHRNFCSVPLSVQYNGVQSALRMGRTFEELSQQQITPAALLTVPLFHVTGCHGLMLGMLSAHGKLVMMHKWDAEEALNLIERERITLFGAVPTMVWQLIDCPDIDSRDTSSVLNVGYGGAPAAPELLRRIKQALPSVVVTNGWGITETSSSITAISGADYEQKPDSVGPPFPVCDVKVVGQSGETLPCGSLGELWVRGPNVVKGYWNNPGATAESFTDGWFHTGDIGKIDEEGCIYIVDRIKDMIIRGGENVYCAEVEAAILEHPAVSAACVFGIPHEVLGETVACVVEIRPGTTIEESVLQSYLHGKLAKFKVPERVWLRSEPLPLGATGKVQKKELREFYINN